MHTMPVVLKGAPVPAREPLLKACWNVLEIRLLSQVAFLQAYCASVYT